MKQLLSVPKAGSAYDFENSECLANFKDLKRLKKQKEHDAREAAEGAEEAAGESLEADDLRFIEAEYERGVWVDFLQV